MSGPTVYPVGIVGERHYQPAIRRCGEGDRVRIEHEPDNPHDDRALVVRTANRQTIGYISHDSWLQEAIHDQGSNVWASIVSIKSGGGGALDLVLGVALVPDEAGDWVDPGQRPAKIGWLRKLFGR